MPGAARILALAGSTREGSFNKRLLTVAIRAVEAAGGTVTRVDLRDLPLPLYDGDLEARDGLPANARKLKAEFVAHHGLLLACPEYNSSITGVLKNAIDWVSRPEPDEPPLVAYTGKVAGLLSASPGALGGLRGLVTVQSILGNIGVLVLPEQVAVPKANMAFGPDGLLSDEKLAKAVEKVARRLVETVGKLGA